MAISVRSEVGTSTCDNCPKRRALMQQMFRVAAETNCPADSESYQQYAHEQLDLLEQAATETGCRDIEKSELPGLDEEVPELGEEWGEFARKCLAHETYIQLREVKDPNGK